MTSKFNEEAGYLQLKQVVNNHEWIYEILSASLELSSDDLFVLKPVDTSKLEIRNDKMKIIYNPLKIKSSYSENFENIINFVQSNK